MDHLRKINLFAQPRRHSIAAMTNLMVVLTNAVAGRDDELNEWYDNEHIPQVLALPGFVSAQRFRLGDGQVGPELSPQGHHRYLALYEIEIDPAEALRVLGEEVDSGRMGVSPALDLSSTAQWTFEPIGPRVSAEPRSAG